MRLLTTLALLLTALPSPAAPWVRLRSAGIELISDAGEKTARQTLDRLAQIQSTIPGSVPLENGSPKTAAKLRIFLFASERDYQDYAVSTSTAGFFQSGLDRDYIVLHAGDGLSQVIAHEYVHFVMRQQRLSQQRTSGNRFPLQPLPAWFEEGTAEFYSNVEVARGTVRVGGLLENRRSSFFVYRHDAPPLYRLPLDAQQFRSRSPDLLNGTLLVGQPFYAQSWALVHMLHLAPEYAPGLAGFQRLLDTGLDDDTAFQQAFGHTLEQALWELPAYVRTMQAPAATRQPANPKMPPTAVDPILPNDAILLKADLALRRGRMSLAQTLFEQAARDFPASPATAVGLGQLALAQGRRSDARMHWERALELNSTDADVWFQYAILLQDESALDSRIRVLLEKALELEPNFADAHLLLGTQATDRGGLQEALDHLTRAAQLQPRKSYVWYSLAFAQDKAGQRDQAIRSARAALSTADSDEHQNMAQALLQSLTR